MNLSIAPFDAIEMLPPDCAPLLAAGAAQGFELSAAWFGVLQRAAMPAGARPCFLLCRDGTRPLAVFPMQQVGDRLAALTSPYTCRYAPLTAPEAGGAELQAAALAFGRYCRRFGAVRLDAMDAAWPGLAPLLAGLRAAGLVPLRFAHFGNWHEAVAGRGWNDYLAARPGALRETIRRRLRRLAGDPELALETVAGPAGLQQGVAAYEEVYARSWKRPEPFPAFSAALMRAAAQEGALRLGILRQRGKPVAAQYWIVAAGTALVAKLAHDESAKALSPGTLLTAAMLHGLLEAGGIAELDFGRGDDAYKSQWAASRRQRIGFVLAAPQRARGLAQIARHLLGQASRRLPGRRRKVLAG